MTAAASILAFSGSTREASANKKVLAIAAAAARDAGATVTTIDLRDFPLPLYDGDLEERDGVPAAALELKSLFRNHRGLLIATPEYNTSLSGVLKNTIDWVSRPVKDEPHLAPFGGKIAGLVSATLGPFGGLRSQAHLRQILEAIGVMVIPEHWGVGGLNEQTFDAADNLADDTSQKMVQRVGVGLTRFLERLSD